MRQFESLQCVAPLAQGSEYLDFIGQRSATKSLCRSGNLGYIATQEGIGVEFIAKQRGNCCLVLRNHLLQDCSTLLQSLIARFHCKRKGQVEDGVFMAAIDLCVARQGRNSPYRLSHLGHRSIKQPAASKHEQGVTAKQNLWAIIGNMSQRMTSYIQDVELQIKAGYSNALAAQQVVRAAWDVFPGRAENGYAELLVQGADAARMVRMAMRDQDRGELVSAQPQMFEYRGGVARINDHGIAGVAQYPDVVVGERPQANDGQFVVGVAIRWWQ